MSEKAMDRAIQAIGSKSAMARLLGVSRQAIGNWRGKVPASHCRVVEKATGIPRAELRPDIYAD
jgi:DNA-binding transcriptional regulator YdaS (Cro superfamily)